VLTRSRPVERLSLAGLPWRSLGLAIAGAAALHLMLRAAVPLVERLLEPVAPESIRQTRAFEETVHGALREHPWLTLIAVTVLPAVCEEALFRGWFVPLRARPAPALLVSSLIFAAVHAHAPRIVATFALGLYFGAVLLATRSLWAAVGAHAVNNLLAVMLPESHPVDPWIGLAALPAFALALWLLRLRAVAAER
jgi:CAAX protease family protein